MRSSRLKLIRAFACEDLMRWLYKKSSTVIKRKLKISSQLLKFPYCFYRISRICFSSTNLCWILPTNHSFMESSWRQSLFMQGGSFQIQQHAPGCCALYKKNISGGFLQACSFYCLSLQILLIYGVRRLQRQRVNRNESLTTDTRFP